MEAVQHAKETDCSAWDADCMADVVSPTLSPSSIDCNRGGFEAGRACAIAHTAKLYPETRGESLSKY